MSAILNFAVSKSVFRGLEHRNLWIVFWPLTKLSTCVYHIPKGNKYLKKNKDCLLYRCVKSCFHLAAILNFAVSWCEAWNPLLGDCCSEDPMASLLDISSSEDSWHHTSHQLSQLTDKFKTNMNIIFKSNVRALPGLRVSPRVFQRSQICDTHVYSHHLITCANQKRIGSGNTRFFSFTCYAFKQQKQCL